MQLQTSCPKCKPGAGHIHLPKVRATSPLHVRVHAAATCTSLLADQKPATPNHMWQRPPLLVQMVDLVQMVVAGGPGKLHLIPRHEGVSLRQSCQHPATIMPCSTKPPAPGLHKSTRSQMYMMCEQRHVPHSCPGTLNQNAAHIFT